MLDLLLELNAQSETAVLLATHDDQVSAAAQRVFHMRDGMIVNSEVGQAGLPVARPGSEP